MKIRSIKCCISFLLLLCMVLGLMACGENTGEVTTNSASKQAGTSESTKTPAVEDSTQSTTSGSNILIAYFTWADNTVVENSNAVDVDARTSASLLPPGHVAQMATWIQDETGGDLFSIVVTEPYSSNYDDCLERAADEKADNARPELAKSVNNMENYDVVFLGYPDWWYTCPMAVLSFLDSYNFSGKTVIPFCAHGTSGLAGSVREIQSALPEDVKLLEAIGVQRPGMDTPISTAKTTVKNWLDELGY